MRRIESGTIGEFYVYALLRLDGSPFYIGKGKGDRWLHHERYGSCNKHLVSIITNSGGTVPKIKLVEGVSSSEAAALEIAIIAMLGRHPDGPLVNLTDGGDGKVGYATPQETRIKIGRAHAGMKHSEETRARMRASAPKTHSKSHNDAVSTALKGRVISEEWRAKMRASSALRWSKSSERDKIKAYFVGLSEEDKLLRSKKISEATKLAMSDPAIRLKISLAMRARS